MNLKAYARMGCTRVDKISSRVGSEEIDDCRIALNRPVRDAYLHPFYIWKLTDSTRMEPS